MISKQLNMDLLDYVGIVAAASVSGGAVWLIRFGLNEGEPHRPGTPELVAAMIGGGLTTVARSKLLRETVTARLPEAQPLLNATESWTQPWEW